MIYVAVFFFMAVTDFVWAEYNGAIAAKRAKKAALMSALIIVMGAFLTIQLVNNYWVMIPEALGAYAGTYLSVVRQQKAA